MLSAAGGAEIEPTEEAGGGEIISLPAYRSGRDYLEDLIRKGGSSKGHVTNLLYVNTQKGDLNGMIACVEHGADVNFGHGDKSETPALMAIRMGRKDLLEYLLDCGAIIEPTMIRMCCEFNQLDILQYLQSKGVDITTCGAEKHSPATYAAMGGHVNVLEFLLESGQDVLKPDFDGSPPAFAAARFGKVEALKYLASLGANLDHQRPDGTTAVFAAAEFGRIDCLNFLIQSGADVNLAKSNGVTPAFIAASNNQVGSLRALTEAGIDIEQEANSFTLAIVATGKGHLESLKFLIDQGVNLDRGAGDRASTAAHCAAQLGRIDSMMVLAAYGADLGIKKHGGITPAHVAAAYGNEAILQFLAQRREDLFVQDDVGRTPMFLASQKSHMKCVLFLQRHLNDLVEARAAEVQFFQEFSNGDTLPD